MIRRLSFILVVVLGIWSVAHAQTGGQFWVKAFEDLNSNGLRDQGEPVLTRGIGVNLLNAEGVVVASALLDSSPNASQGLVGFQFLPPGAYSVVVTSAEYTATTPQTINATITEGALPTVVEFGGQPIAPVQPVAPTPDPNNPLTSLAPVMEQLNQFNLVQIGAAAAASVVSMCGTAILGIILYLILALRGRTREVEEIKMNTGAMRPVRVTDTGEYRRK